MPWANWVLNGGFQGLRDNAVPVAFDAHQFGVVAEHLAHGPHVEELLGQHHVAGVGQGLNYHGNSLAGPGSQHNVISRHPHVPVSHQLVRHQLAQGWEAGGVWIVGEFSPLPVHGVLQRLGQFLQRESIGVGIGDRKIVLGARESAADSDPGVIGKQALVVERLLRQNFTIFHHLREGRGCGVYLEVLNC